MLAHAFNVCREAAIKAEQNTSEGVNVKELQEATVKHVQLVLSVLLNQGCNTDLWLSLLGKHKRRLSLVKSRKR